MAQGQERREGNINIRNQKDKKEREETLLRMQKLIEEERRGKASEGIEQVQGRKEGRKKERKKE